MNRHPDYNCEILLANQLGFANYFPNQQELHIGFSSFLLIFYPSNFHEFVRCTEEHFSERKKDREPENLKNIIIPTPIREVSILFNLKELEDFAHFLKKIESIIIVKELAKNAISKHNKENLN